MIVMFLGLSICGTVQASRLGSQAQGRNGVVVSGHVDSAAAGLEMLRKGGNAVDAAVAVLLAESVANSDKVCFGGEVAILVYDAGRKTVEAISGVGAAPQLATVGYFEKAGGIKGGTAPSAAVPAALDACVTLLKRYGTTTFSEAVQPALRMLDKGTAKWHGDLAKTLRRLTEAETAAPDRQRGLQAVADCFYRGPIAHEIDAWSQAHNGLIRYADLAHHVSHIEPPVSTEYRGYRVYKCGPWTQGPALLEALQLLAGFDLRAMGFQSADALHVLVEAMKLAFADRDACYGDPLCVKVPLDFLLSQEYARTRRPLIDLQKASLELRPGHVPDKSRPRNERPADMSQRGDETLAAAGWPPQAQLACSVLVRAYREENALWPWPPSCYALTSTLRTKAFGLEAATRSRASSRIYDTTTCLAADRWGNVVAATPSGWGGVLVGDTGIRLGSRLISLNTQRGHPNCLAPGKRPRITLTPTLVLQAGRPVLAVSVAGGDTQDQASLQIVTNFIDFGLDAAHLVSTPRYATEHFIGSFNQRPPLLGRLTIDPRVGADVLESLRQRGHQVNPTTVTGQERTVIVLDPDTGMMSGAGDPEAVPARAAAAF
jgi:gamma-glutamyltranspeptidase/glutathione hydrolase